MKIFLLLLIKFSMNQGQQPQYWDDLQQEIIAQNKLNQFLKEEGRKAKEQFTPPRDEYITVNGDEVTKMRDLKRIADAANDTEKVYSDCIMEIPDINYDAQSIKTCIGKESIYIINDFDHLVKTINSYYENSIRDLIQRECYGKATDFVSTNGCEVFERDALDFLWKELKVDELLDQNKIKYTFEVAHLEEEAFAEMLEYLKGILPHYYDLLDEAYNHRDLTVVRVQKIIDEKT